MSNISELSKKLIIAGAILIVTGIFADIGMFILMFGILNFIINDQDQPSEPSNVSTSSYDMDYDYADSSCADSEVI